MNLELKGKRALVFGSSSGIGLGIAKALAEEGARVALVARDPEKLNRAKQEIGAELAISADLYEPKEVKRVVQSVLENWGTIDILVTHNGGPAKGHFEEISSEKWNQSFNGLWLSVVESIQSVLPGMKKQKWGRILMITSIAAKESLSNLTVSNSLRAGLLGLAKSLSNEVASDGITVNTILPGFTETSDMTPALHALAEKTPAKRLATTKEQGSLAAFLASSQAGYITGQAIACDGGFLRGN